MFILDVIPLTNIPIGQPQVFSYFSKENLERGCLVEVFLNRRKIMAVVLKSESITSRKAIIKKSGFALKPISKVISSRPSVPPLFFVLADFIARYYFSPISLSLKSILPPKIKSLSKYIQNLSAGEFPEYFQITKPLESKEMVKKHKSYNFSNDFSLLIKEIKKCLVKKQQVLILVPTILYQKYYLGKLKTFLNEKIYIASPDLKIKELDSLWSKINNQEALLVIGRRSSVFLPWQDLGLIIAVDANNSSYKSWDQKPYYNAITLARYLSLYYYAKNAAYQNY